MIIWDQEAVPQDVGEEVACWRSYFHGGLVFSVPQYLEGHAERLRIKYLAFIHDLGESRVDAKRIVEHLDAGDGFSLWWMTQLAEKSPFKSPQIYACLRLMALEEILLERKPGNLTLDSSDRNLAQAVQALCRNLNIRFIWRHGVTYGKRRSLRDFYRVLPYPLQGLISLRHVLAKWSLRKLRKPRWFSGADAIFMCSYFFNMNESRCAAGEFYARQWEGLPEFLRKNQRHGNWIHHFLLSPGTPDAKTALDWVYRFNGDAGNQGYHAFLETYLSPGVILRALKKWIWLNVVSWRLRKFSLAFRLKGSAVWLWPLLRSDWKTSLTGAAAVNNCLWIELFDAALKDMPRQELGLYLWENQGWECALIRAWRKYGHGEIIGVPHTTVIFWHLNNFDDPRSLNSTQVCAKPLPNRLAINGPVAWNAFRQTAYPAERLVEVEALRFQYLAALDSKLSKKAGDSSELAKIADHVQPKKILVLGDFTVKQTLKMLRCVEAALHLAGVEMSVTLKPHPVCRIGREDFPSLSFDLTDRPLVEIMQDFDFAFSSNTTSAAVDALLAGLPVAVFLDEEDFNHSPLRGIAGISFVGMAEDLAAVLQSARRGRPLIAAEDFFWLSDSLPRWRAVLLKSGHNE